MKNGRSKVEAMGHPALGLSAPGILGGIFKRHIRHNVRLYMFAKLGKKKHEVHDNIFNL